MSEMNNIKEIQIGLASPEQILTGPTARLKNLKRLTIGLRNLSETVCFVSVFLVLPRTGSATVENIRKFVIKVLSVIAAV